MKVRPLLINRLHMWKKKAQPCFRLRCRVCLQLSVYTSFIIWALFWTNGPSEMIANNWNHPIASAFFLRTAGIKSPESFDSEFFLLMFFFFPGGRFSAAFGCGPSCDFHWLVAGGDDQSKTKQECRVCHLALFISAGCFPSVVVVTCALVSERGASGRTFAAVCVLVGVSFHTFVFT